VNGGSFGDCDAKEDIFEVLLVDSMGHQISGVQVWIWSGQLPYGTSSLNSSILQLKDSGSYQV